MSQEDGLHQLALGREMPENRPHAHTRPPGDLLRRSLQALLPCIRVTHVRDGRIIEARDYNGPATKADIAAQG